MFSLGKKLMERGNDHKTTGSRDYGTSEQRAEARNASQLTKKTKRALGKQNPGQLDRAAGAIENHGTHAHDGFDDARAEGVLQS